MWKYNPSASKRNEAYRAHFFDRDGHRSICGRVLNTDEWIDDIAGGNHDCGRCLRTLERMERVESSGLE